MKMTKKIPPKTDKTRQLFSIYGQDRKTKQLICLSQGYATSESEIKDLIRETYKSLSSKGRKRYNRNFRARKVKKVNVSMATKEVLEQATILEIPIENRIKHFGEVILEQHKDGWSLLKLKKYYGVNYKKLNDFIKANVPE